MNHERASLVERLQAEAADLLGETPTLFAYGIADSERFPGLRDVQVAAYMDPALPPESYFHVEIRLEALLEEALSISASGVRILNAGPLTLQGAVLEAGRVIFSRDEPARIAYEERVRQEYFDLKSLLAAHAGPAEETTVTIHPEEIAPRLQRLNAWMARLRDCGDTTSSDAVRDAAICYYLQSAITSCLGVCLYLLSALKLRPPRDVTDIPEVLAEVGILEGEIARELTGLIEVRHRLVHLPEQEHWALLEGLSGYLASLDRFKQAARTQLNI